MSIEISRTAYAQAAQSAVPAPSAKPVPETKEQAAVPIGRKDRVEISDQGLAAVRQQAEEDPKAEAQQGTRKPKDDPQAEEPSEEGRESVAFNAAKRARQLAAAKTPDQVRQVIALLEQDLSDCKAGLERGACGEEEVAKVEAMLRQAKGRMAQVAGNEDEEQPGLSAFDLASLM